MADELNEQLEFEERIKTMPPDDRTIFIAQQTYFLTSKVDKINTKVDCLDTKLDNFAISGITKKTSATTGGITAAVIIGIVEGLKAVFGK